MTRGDRVRIHAIIRRNATMQDRDSVSGPM